MKKWGTFNWEDPFNIESRLTEDEKLFRDAFRRYCDEKLMTRIVQDNRNNVFDRDIMYELGELGALGSTCPAEYGCAEVNYVTYGLGLNIGSPTTSSRIGLCKPENKVLKEARNAEKSHF